MDPILMTLLALRGLATVLTLQGQPATAGAINALLTAYEAGRDVDAYMQEIADKLALGEIDDWEDITGRINAEVSEFLARGSGSEPE